MGPDWRSQFVFLIYLVVTTCRPLQSTETPEHSAENTDLNTNQRRGTELLGHIIKSVNLRPKREAQIQRTMDLDLVRRRLNESLIAANDLKLRANETYDALIYKCQLKIMYLPHEDSTLNTCRRFAVRSIEDPEFNIPPLATFTFNMAEDVRQEIRGVLGTALRIFGRYRFVVSNLTTLEENHLCNGVAGLQCGTSRCSHARLDPNDPFSLLCRMKVLESRVRALFYTLKRTNEALDLELETQTRTLTVTSPPELSEYRRMMYGFGVTYQLHRQAQTFEYVLRFVNNLEEEALGLT